MKYLLLICIVLTGCGYSINRTHVEQGRVVRQTTGGVGYMTIDIETRSNSPRMATCVERLGPMPGHEEYALCRDRIRRDEERDGDIKDLEAYPYYYGY